VRPSTVYLVRHGLAVDVGAAGAGTDRDRYLSDEGKAVMQLEGRALRSLGVTAGVILASPYARAEETAQILRTRLAHPGAVVTTDLLAPGGDPAAVLGLLRDQTQDPIMVVSHIPLVERLAGHLLAARDARQVRMHAGGIACLSFPEWVAAGQGVLEWLMTPEQLMRCAPEEPAP
jgi:phosphohistidine phosphatase